QSVLQGLQLSVRQETGELRQPARRGTPEEVEQRGVTRSSGESPERFQHREVGLPFSIVFDALAAPNPHPVSLFGRLGPSLQLVKKRFDQGGLADPRLSGDKDDLTFTAQGRVQGTTQLRELRRSTHKHVLGGPVASVQGKETLDFVPAAPN